MEIHKKLIAEGLADGFTRLRDYAGECGLKLIKENLRAFCGSSWCVKGSMGSCGLKHIFMVTGLGDGVMVDVKLSEINCPGCGHALFWSSSFKKRSKKLKIRGIDPQFR